MRNSAIFSIISGWLFLFLALSFQAAPGLAAVSTATASFAADSAITGTFAGPLTRLTVTASVQVASADAGKNGVIYVMANVANMWFFKGSGGNWAIWNGGPFPAPYLQEVLGSHSIPVVENMDLGLFPGTEFYVGYGLGQAEQGQADMVANVKYRKLAAGPTTPLAGIWTMASVTGPFFDNTPQAVMLDANGTMIHIGQCSFSAAYTASGNTLLVSISANDGSANCGSDDAPGTALSFTYTLSGDTLTLTARDGSVAMFQKSLASSPIGTWTLLYTTNPDRFPPGNTFTLDANRILTTSYDQCVFTSIMAVDLNSQFGPWIYTVAGNNNQCGPDNAPGSISSGQFVIMENTIYIWMQDALGVFSRIK